MKKEVNSLYALSTVFNQRGRVAQRLNISQVQVSRLEKKIIAKLRSHLNEQ